MTAGTTPGSAWGLTASAGTAPGTRFSRPHCGHFTNRPANSSFSSYDVPHRQATRTATVASVWKSPNLWLDREAVTRRFASPHKETTMRHSFAPIALLAVATTAWAQAPPPRPAAPPGPMKGGRLIDGAADAPQSGVGSPLGGGRVKTV